MRAITDDPVSPSMALCGIVADDRSVRRQAMRESAIPILVAALILVGIGVALAAAWAQRRGTVRCSRYLRLALPARFFACALLNASHPWQHRAQHLVGVTLDGVFAAAWALAMWRVLRRAADDGDAACG